MNRNGYGIYLSNSKSNIISNNSFCASSNSYDIYLSASTGSGTGNKCEKPDGWNDTNMIGCTYLCNYKPNTTLVSPTNNTISYDGNITLTCSAYDSDDYDLSNITLYHNIDGIWHANQTKNLSGFTDSATFILNNIPNGTYQWNCLAYDQDYYNATSKSDFADKNRTFIVNITPLFMLSSLKELYSDFNKKVFEFQIDNPRATRLDNISWILDTGDNNTIVSITNISLDGNENAIIIAEYNYSEIGTYIVIVNVSAEGISSSINISINVTKEFAVNEINELYTNGLEKISEFKIKNNEDSSMNNINWSFNLDDGNVIYADKLINLSVGEEVFIYVWHNYSSSGNYLVNATAFNSEQIDSKTKLIAVTDIDVLDLQVLHSNTTSKVFGFIINNTLKRL
jgi:hypothetical protein